MTIKFPSTIHAIAFSFSDNAPARVIHRFIENNKARVYVNDLLVYECNLEHMRYNARTGFWIGMVKYPVSAGDEVRVEVHYTGIGLPVPHAGFHINARVEITTDYQSSSLPTRIL